MSSEQKIEAQSTESKPEPSPAPAEVSAPARSRARWMGALGLTVVAAIAGTGAARYALTEADPEEAPEPIQTSAVLSVNTAWPQSKTLVRRHEQPGSILPFAQVELYAKTSGYLRWIRRDITPETVLPLLGQPNVILTGLAGGSTGAFAAVLRQAPPVDIGSRVSAGDVLLEIDVPEREQDVAEREAILQQRMEELEQTKTAIETAQAAVEVARAHRAQADSDVKRFQSDYNFRKKELVRIRDLVHSRAVEPRLLDEKQSQVDAAWAAYESSRARIRSAQADLTLTMSKLATARSDVRVKEALVQVARADVERARILLEYGRIRAPFDGLITYRSVDEGDFVQNSQSGQSRHLMTLTATDRVKVVLHVPSREAVLVRQGAEVTVTVDSRPGESFLGQVTRLRRVLDPQSRTMQVEVDLDNRKGRLMPGMYGHLSVVLDTIQDARVVPAAALYSRKGVNYLLVVRDGVVHRQPVRIIFDEGDQVQVVKLVEGREVPLETDEEVVISGKGEIAEGQRVRSPSSARAHRQ